MIKNTQITIRYPDSRGGGELRINCATDDHHGYESTTFSFACAHKGGKNEPVSQVLRRCAQDILQYVGEK